MDKHICYDIMYLENEDSDVVLHGQEYGHDKQEAVKNLREFKPDAYIVQVIEHDGSFNPNDN